ncbi:MAG: 16S rRNA (uracil(1498)-N(3))-methyltransferase [Dethiobacteria bacterium]
MPHFFLEGEKLEAGRKVRLKEEDTFHAYRVLRLRPGDEVTLADGQGKACRGVIAASGAAGVEVQVTGPFPAAESPLEVTLAHSLSKGEKMDLVVRQAVELGVRRIIPLVTERSVPRLTPDREEKRLRRWRSIARSAAAQCRRAFLPQVERLHSLAYSLEWIEGCLALVPWEEEREAGFMDLREQPFPGPGAVLVFIGPEGGFSREEVELLTGAGAHRIHLGPRILRTETAAVVALALIQARWGDLGGGRA